MPISYSLTLFPATMSKNLLMLVSSPHSSYLNKRTDISKNKMQNYHAIERLVLKLFFVANPFKSSKKDLGSYRWIVIFLSGISIQALRRSTVYFEN